MFRHGGVCAAGCLAAARAQDVRAQVFAWVEAKKVDPATRAKAEAIWSDLPATASEDELLVRLARTFALLDSSAAKLLAMCSEPRSRFVVPAEGWLRDGGAPPLFTANLRLLYARWLVHESLFDEARTAFRIDAGRRGRSRLAVVLPERDLSCAIEQGVGPEVARRIALRRGPSPRRYVALARLMEEDLQGLQDDTLDHIARRMDDIRRRLDLGRAGPKVRKEEDGVIQSLDKMIKKLEEQQKECQGGGNANSLRPSKPAPTAFPGRERAGRGTKKDIGSGSGWGDLPPKSAKRPCSRSAVISPPIIATRSNSTSAVWPRKEGRGTRGGGPGEIDNRLRFCTLRRGNP